VTLPDSPKGAYAPTALVRGDMEIWWPYGQERHAVPACYTHRPQLVILRRFRPQPACRAAGTRWLQTRAAPARRLFTGNDRETPIINRNQQGHFREDDRLGAVDHEHLRQSQRVLRAVILNCQVDERSGTGETRDAVGMGNRFDWLSILPFRADAVRELNRVHS
jgi:hypothetical protein